MKQAQQQVYDAVDKQITAWGIEHNAAGWRSDAYLYCNETRCPECGWLVPLAPSWVIGEKTKTIALLEPDEVNQRFDILIKSGVSNTDLAAAKSKGTVKDSDLHCPHCGQSTPMQMIRGDRKETWGLRLWENADLVPRPDNVHDKRDTSLTISLRVPHNLTAIDTAIPCDDKAFQHNTSHITELIIILSIGNQAA